MASPPVCDGRDPLGSDLRRSLVSLADGRPRADHGDICPRALGPCLFCRPSHELRAFPGLLSHDGARDPGRVLQDDDLGPLGLAHDLEVWEIKWKLLGEIVE